MTARILTEAPTNAAKGWTAKPVRPARRRRPLLGVCTAPTNGIDAASIAAMHIKISRDRKPVIVLAAVKGKALSRRPKWPPLTAASRDGAAILCRDGGMVRVLTEQRNECQQQSEFA